MSFKMSHIIHIFRSYSCKTPVEQPRTNNYPKNPQSPAKPDALLDLLHGVIKKNNILLSTSFLLPCYFFMRIPKSFHPCLYHISTKYASYSCNT